MRDPSMTQLQIVVSMIAALVSISRFGQGNGALLMFLTMPRLFGVLRLNFSQMANIGVIGVTGYGVVIAIALRTHPERVSIAIELLNLISLASVMIFVCIMYGYISKVRQDLSVAVARIRPLAERDPLTGLFNRCSLIAKLAAEIARCERRLRHGITVCMVAIDRFKLANDKFGHPVGDEVIRLEGSASVRRSGSSMMCFDVVETSSS